MDGTHKHKCYGCNHIWEHSDRCAGQADAHKCEKCGREQWTRHYESINAEIQDMVNSLARTLDR